MHSAPMAKTAIDEGSPRDSGTPYSGCEGPFEPFTSRFTLDLSVILTSLKTLKVEC